MLRQRERKVSKRHTRRKCREPSHQCPVRRYPASPPRKSLASRLRVAAASVRRAANRKCSCAHQARAAAPIRPPRGLRCAAPTPAPRVPPRAAWLEGEEEGAGAVYGMYRTKTKERRRETAGLPQHKLRCKAQRVMFVQCLTHAAQAVRGEASLGPAASAAKCGERNRRRLRLDSTTHTLDAAMAPAAASGGRRARICTVRATMSAQVHVRCATRCARTAG